MASAATVRLTREAKRLLEKLQASLVLEHGVKPPLYAIVEAALRLAWRRRGELLAELEGWRPLGREEAERLLEEHIVDVGETDAARDHDEVVYGGVGVVGAGGYERDSRGVEREG